MNESHTQGGWKRLLNLILQAKPPKLPLAIALFFSLVTTVASLLVPLFTKDLVNGFSADSIGGLQIAGLAVVFIVQVVTGGISVYLLNYGGNRVVASIRERLWSKLLTLPVPYYDNRQTGETVSRLTNDTSVIKGLITEHLPGLVTGVISIVGSMSLLFYMNWRMTAVMLVVFPLAALIFIPIGRRMYKVSKSMQAETARFTSVVSRVVSEIRLVKASGSESVEYRQGADGIGSLLRIGLREARIYAIVNPMVSFVILMLLVAIIGFGGAQVSSGAITAGELVAFILYLFQIILPVTQLSQFFTQYQKAMGATESIIDILHSEEEDREKGIAEIPTGEPLVIDSVTFGYKPGEPVLHGVTFEIEPGKVTAIVGPSGSGKTTVFGLVEQFYRPESGIVRLGSRDIGEFALNAWRRQIGYVSQESPIIAGTIRDNIAYGLDREVTDEEMERAARMAYADGFIRDMPEGFGTEVGERGIKLSGGQRQRIAIARALLRNPRILMLDEATSSLDSKSEEIVQQALDNLMAGRTTIVIAHRLSTVIDADRIVFLERGRVTGIGTHEQLYQTHPLYREFADQQLRLGEGALGLT